MITTIIIALIIMALALWAVDYLPFPPVPKQVTQFAIIAFTALYLGSIFL